MKTTSIRARSLACALLAGTAFCGLTAQPAAAQSAGALPRYNQVDENGVDLVTGNFSFSLDEGAIGTGNGAVSLARYWTGSGRFTDNWSGALYETANGAIVEFGSISDSFTFVTGTGYVSDKGDGATLQFPNMNTFVYTARDGTVINFRRRSFTSSAMLRGEACAASPSGECSVPTLITRPDGTKFALTWDFGTTSGGTYVRPRSVTSSAGFAVTLNYAGNTPGSGSQPHPDWYRKTGAGFANNVTACDSACPSVTYGDSGGIHTITDALGRQWRLDISSGQLTGIRRPGSTSDTTSVAYGTGGVVSSVTREGITTSYSRVVSGNTATTTITDALSQQKVAVADLSIGRVISVTDELSRTTGYSFDSNGRLTRITAPEGNYTQLTYDARGNVAQAQAVAKSGSGLPAITTSASYDSSCANVVKCNQPNSITDARGNVTDYTYDSTHGGVLTVTAPAPTSGATPPQVRYGYTLTASPVMAVTSIYLPTSVSACQSGSSCAGTADEVKSTLGYNSQFAPVSLSTGAGDNSLTATHAMTYDPAGNLLTVDGPLSGSADTVRYRYNAAREAIGIVSADPDDAGSLKHRAQRITIDGRGFVTRVERGTVNSQSDSDWASFVSLEEVQADYDGNARHTVRKLVAGGTVHALAQTGYDALGRPECTAQRMDSADFGSTLPAACTLTSPAGSHGPDRITKTIYDAAGQVIQVRTALGTADEANEVTATYRDNGQVQTVKDGENNLTTYEYDGHDRLAKTRYPDATKGAGTSSTSDYEQPTYESLAGGTGTSTLVTSFRNRAGETIGFGYDALGRLASKDRPGSEPDVSYGYDLLGRMISASQTGQALGFTYDALGRNLNQTGPLGTVASEYDVAGRRTRLTWPDTFYVTYDHLVTGETTAIRENGAASGIGVIATLAYDDLGRRTSLTRGNGTVTHYEHDPVSRLEELRLEFAGTARDLALGFAYNPASQIASTARSNDLYAWTGHGSGTTSTTANGRNQIAGWVSTLGYDAKGNITSDGTYSYTYSSENLLTSLTNPAGTVQTASTFAYDPLMRLAVIDSTNSGLDVQFGYDGLEMVYEGLSANRTRRYVYGPGIDEPLVGYLITTTGTSRLWYHGDERGSIVSLSDDAGTPGGIGKFDEYGVGGMSRFRYTGQYWLGDANLLYYRARIYDPRLGRFLQPDPIGYGGGMNMYTYVGGDPVNFTDPLGLQEKEEEIVITGKRLKVAAPSFNGAAALRGAGESGFWANLAEALGGIGGDGTIQQETKCKLGNGAIDVTFDGTTLNITANINLVGPGAATSGAYIDGIAKAWTRPLGHINSIANISAGPGGITAHISSGIIPPGGPRSTLGGNEMWLGNLGAMTGRQVAYATQHVVAHEFGHSFGIPNMPNEGKWVGSIMANSANDVSPTDLEAVVELCRAAE